MDDRLALGLAGREGRALLDRLRAEVPGPYLLAFSRWMCVRARFTEDIVEQAAASGIGQYVILGAGLDSFAYRRNDLLGRLRVFEVDHRPPRRGSGGGWPGSALSPRPGLYSPRWTSSGRPCGRG
jgi:methyltransferase (TIGR00027 family)